MNATVDTALAVRFLYQLVTPFTETKAYKLGIIDENGNKIRPATSLEDRDAYNKFHVLVFNLKQLIAKAPGGSSKIASYAAAAWLLKEHADDMTADNVAEYFTEALTIIDEEAAANAAGGGNVAGIGVGPDGEPGVTKKKRKKYKELNKLDNTNLLKRPAPKV